MTYYPGTTADFVSNATASSKESVTGAAVPGPALTIVEFEFRGSFTVAATTTGVGFGILLPSGATIEGVSEVTFAAAAGTDQIHTQLLTASDTFAVTTDVAATTTNRFRVSGRVAMSTTAGDIQLRVDTDAAAAVTVKKGVSRWSFNECAA
jgi:hypothetical protein